MDVTTSLGDFNFVGYKGAWNYPKQNEFIRKTIVQSLSFYEAITSTKQENDQYIGQGLKMQKQLQVNKDNQIDRLEGNEYLNALLFSRYRQVFNKNPCATRWIFHSCSRLN